MLPSEALAKMQQDIKIVIAEVVQGLLAELTANTPVDTAQLKGAWNISKKDDYSWVLSNNMEYASIIFEGRRLVAGKYYGSLQLVDGIDPILEKWNDILQNRLDKLNY